MDELTKGDREKGSLEYVVMALKTKINAMKLTMNKDYMVFMNITFIREGICSSCVNQRKTGTYQQATLGIPNLQKRMALQQRRKHCQTKGTSNNGKAKENAKSHRSSS